LTGPATIVGKVGPEDASPWARATPRIRARQTTTMATLF